MFPRLEATFFFLIKRLEATKIEEWDRCVQLINRINFRKMYPITRLKENLTATAEYIYPQSSLIEKLFLPINL